MEMGSTPSSFPKIKGHPLGGLLFLEQDTGVEPAFTAWETLFFRKTILRNGTQLGR
jgi:hypothetical protein